MCIRDRYTMNLRPRPRFSIFSAFGRIQPGQESKDSQESKDPQKLELKTFDLTKIAPQINKLNEQESQFEILTKIFLQADTKLSSVVYFREPLEPLQPLHTLEPLQSLEPLMEVLRYCRNISFLSLIHI
eukprot:TRINITY_DN17601_c0_g1_i1.p1 TRINITY_DN17601_c0_g1~~TRINITY_DN17601_c0_g1_i1.p1  ORF type:complete len:137 (+),score=18.15 TRINITY_DN17601_c0_g1_i1:25-411(+)